MLLKEKNNILKLLKKNISTIMYINVNQNLTWEFEPLISSGIELSGHSIMFIIYNDLYDANPNDKKEKPLEMK